MSVPQAWEVGMFPEESCQAKASLLSSYRELEMVGAAVNFLCVALEAACFIFGWEGVILVTSASGAAVLPAPLLLPARAGLSPAFWSWAGLRVRPGRSAARGGGGGGDPGAARGGAPLSDVSRRDWSRRPI